MTKDFQNKQGKYSKISEIKQVGKTPRDKKEKFNERRKESALRFQSLIK